MDIETGFKSLNINYKLMEPSSEESNTASEKQEVNVHRHCAYCLNTVPSKEVYLCDKCHKRAYCSKECQVKDWSLKKGGQGHKNWCSLECGEEDIDWEVAPIEGKGLGLISKRLIPAHYRIMVDAPRLLNHPKIMDLLPVNANLEEKLNFNCLELDAEKSGICLRIARANHDCDPNATHIYRGCFKATILISERDIQPGEEICISYQCFQSTHNNISSEEARSVLEVKWGIFCPFNCFCRDKEVNKLLAETRALIREIPKLALRNPESALFLSQKVLEYQIVLHCSILNEQEVLVQCFQIGILQKILVNEAQDFIQKAYEIECRIVSPNSEQALRYLSYYNDPSVHPVYLHLESRLKPTFG